MTKLETRAAVARGACCLRSGVPAFPERDSTARRGNRLRVYKYPLLFDNHPVPEVIIDRPMIHLRFYSCPQERIRLAGIDAVFRVASQCA